MTVSNKRNIYDAYLNRKENNKKTIEIAKEFNISLQTLYNIKKIYEIPKQESNKILEILVEKIDKIYEYICSNDPQ